MAKQIGRLGMIAGFMWEAFTGHAQRLATPPTANTEPMANDCIGSNLGSYQTAPLTDYRAEYHNLAERIYAAVCARVQPRQACRRTGSYGFFCLDSNETKAKIIIFQQRFGAIFGGWPIDRDGVYILKRVYGESSAPTVGVAPAHSERFTFDRVEDADVEAAVRQVVEAVAEPQTAVAK